MESPIIRFGFGFLAVIYIICGIICGYFFTGVFLEARANADWPQAKGLITKTEVFEKSAGRFYPDVAYSYEVGGQEYVGSRVRTSHSNYFSYKDRSSAARIFKGLHKGEPVMVRYNPNDHSDAILYGGPGFQEYGLLAIPIFILFSGLSGLLKLRKTDHSD